MKNLILTVFLLLFTLSANHTLAQIIDDPLQGSTTGIKVGGSFNSEGYQPGIGENHILYEVEPNTILDGYVEFEIKGFNPANMPVGEDHAFIVMYDGRGISEPVPYFDDFKYNYFRWNFHWRDDKKAFKAVISCAEPTSERINSNYAVFEGGGELRDWYSEPTGSNFNWNTSQWYKIKIEWKNKVFTVYVDGNSVWTTSGPYDYLPQDLRIWLGSGPYKYNSDVNGVTYRNFKLVSLESTGSNYLSISPTTKSVSSNSGSYTVNVSSNVSWTVSDNAGWITTSSSSGNNNGSFSVNYSENSTTTSRTGKVTVTGGGISRTSTITQAGASISDYLIVSPDSQIVPNNAASLIFSIESNISWTIEDSVDWFTVSPTSGSDNSNFVVNVDSNSSFTNRVGEILITGSGLTKKVYVIQNGILPFISVIPETYTVNADSGSVLFEIQSNVDWLTSKNADWITLSTQSGNGNGTLIVEYQRNLSKNNRQAQITIYNDSISVSVNLIQEGSNFYLSVNPKIWNVSRNSGSVIFYIESNVNWSLNSSANWISTSLIDSSGNAEFSAHFTSNTDTSARTGMIFIEGYGIIDTVKIVQENSQPFEIILTSNPAEGGSTAGGGIFGEGSKIEIKATPNTNWKFDNWVEDSTVVSSDSSFSFILKKSRTFIANFSALTAVNTFEKIPESFTLKQNYPNPFNPSTNIQFGVPKRTYVRIIIYNMLGIEVQNLFGDYVDAGIHNLSFSAENLPSGIYFYSLIAKEFNETKKMLLLK